MMDRRIKSGDDTPSRSGTAWAAPGPARGRAGLGFDRQQPFALHALARELARPADCLRLFPRLSFRGFFVMTAQLHLAEDALALHLFLQRLEGLVDVVVTDKNLHACSFLHSVLNWDDRVEL